MDETLDVDIHPCSVSFNLIHSWHPPVFREVPELLSPQATSDYLITMLIRSTTFQSWSIFFESLSIKGGLDQSEVGTGACRLIQQML